jgi:nicotinate-nucleotide--dimethylbenzimidazole phosphoribosyltransferase
MTSLDTLREAIAPPRAGAAAEALRHLDTLTKPPGSLGRLEEVAARLVALTGAAPRVARPVIFTFAADHGVVAEGVSAYPQSVTAQMVENFLRGGAAVNVLARDCGARVVVADFGVASSVAHSETLIRCSLGAGTANMTRGPAMSHEQAEAAIEHGARLAMDAIDAGADLVATGDMGIGNTTAASAITAAITGAPAEVVTGRGTGVDDDGWRRKLDAVRRALAVNRPDPRDGVDVLAKVGGFEIGGLVGVILGGAARRVPVALDGFIAGAAALVAATLAPASVHAMFASHRSAEPGHDHALAHLGLVPYLDLGLRLGEGTGAALFVHLARAATRVYTEMATFKSAGVDGPA